MASPRAAALIDNDNDPKRRRRSFVQATSSLLSAQLEGAFAWARGALTRPRGGGHASDLRRSGILTDFHLVAAPGGERVALHACVAAARSSALRSAIVSGHKEVVLNLEAKAIARLVEIMYDPESSAAATAVGDDDHVLKGMELLNLPMREPPSPPGGPLMAMSGSPTSANMHCKQIIAGQLRFPPPPPRSARARRSC